MRSLNNIGSIAPLIIFFFLIIIAGIIIGVFSEFLTPVFRSETAMDGLMSKAWIAVPILCLIMFAGWLFMTAQKERFNL